MAWNLRYDGPADNRLRADPGGSFGAGRGGKLEMGRPHAHTHPGLYRNPGVSAYRSSACDWTSIGHADYPGPLRGVYRSLAGRAADYGVVHGLCDVASVPSGRGELRETGACTDWHHFVAIGLHGRSDKGRASGYSKGAV